MAEPAIIVVTALRALLWQSGFRPVPVFNHDAQVTSPGKQPLGDKWEMTARQSPPFCVTSPAVSYALNTGILGDGLRPLDLDIDDPKKLRACQAVANRIFGNAPTRWRQDAPRVLMLYRAAEGEPVKRTLTGRSHTKEHSCKIEILGRGQQFVAFGRHPDSGAELEWSPSGPGVLQRDELPEVTEDDIQAYLEACAPIIDAPAPAKGNGHDHNHAAGEPQADTLRIAAALASVPNGGAADWEGWNRVGMAVWRATGGGRAGWEAFNAWSARNHAYSPEVTRARWNHYSISPPTSIGAGTIFHMAAEAETGASRHQQNNVPPKPKAKPQPKPKLAASQPPLAPEPLGQQHPPPTGEADAAEGEELGQRNPSNLPVIKLAAGKLHLITTAAEAAIMEQGVPIYQRGPTLVRPAVWEVPATQGRTALAAGLSALKPPAIIDVLSAAAEFLRFDKRRMEYVRADPPNQIADILLSRYGLWKLPTIAGVITTPTLRPDGSILLAPGYDLATRLYHAAERGLKLDTAVCDPTRADAERAIALLLSLLVDFPFVVIKTEGKPDRHLSRSVALSALITSVVRGALPVAPMHGFRANAPGSGKSYLADLISAIATGQPCPVMSVAPGDEKETEKRLIGLLLAGFPIICMDNVNGELGGDTLAQAIERPLLRLRPLGSSDMITIESRATILANGNRLRVRDDMLRRTLPADLDAEMERPETRTFKTKPVAIVLADRGRYVSAALIIVRAYLAAGSPGCLPPLASFEPWSNLVRSALVWLGCDDPVGVMEQTREEDPGLAELREVMDLWDATFGPAAVTLKAVVAEANQRMSRADENGDIPTYGGEQVLCHPELLEALSRVSGGRGGIDSSRLGYWMRDHAGRIVGARRFIKHGITSSSTRWKLIEIKHG